MDISSIFELDEDEIALALRESMERGGGNDHGLNEQSDLLRQKLCYASFAASQIGHLATNLALANLNKAAADDPAEAASHRERADQLKVELLAHANEAADALGDAGELLTAMFPTIRKLAKE